MVYDFVCVLLNVSKTGTRKVARPAESLSRDTVERDNSSLSFDQSWPSRDNLTQYFPWDKAFLFRLLLRGAQEAEKTHEPPYATHPSSALEHGTAEDSPMLP